MCLTRVCTAEPLNHASQFVRHLITRLTCVWTGEPLSYGWIILVRDWLVYWGVATMMINTLMTTFGESMRVSQDVFHFACGQASR
jgi:hypothetical protein